MWGQSPFAAVFSLESGDFSWLLIFERFLVTFVGLVRIRGVGRRKKGKVKVKKFNGKKFNERNKPMNKTIRNLAIAALFIFPGLSGFPQEVQQEETPAVQPVVVENVAIFPGRSGFP